MYDPKKTTIRFKGESTVMVSGDAVEFLMSTNRWAQIQWIRRMREKKCGVLSTYG